MAAQAPPAGPAAPGGALKLRRVGGGLLDFFNFFAWSVYQPDYYRNISKRDYRMQLLASVITFVVTATLITQGVQDAAQRPLSEATVQSVASPEEVAALFEAQAAGDGSVTGLVCPCAKGETALRAGTSWVLPEDPFCEAMRASVALPSGGGSAPQSTLDFVAAAQSPLSESCIPPAASAAFGADVRALVLQGGLFSEADPEFEDRVALFADALETSLCGLAFGLNDLATFFNPVPAAASGDLLNLCYSAADEAAAQEPLELVPAAFFNSRLGDTVNIIQLQQTRARPYASGAVNLCNTLLRLRSGFLRGMEAAELDTPIALKPEDYQAVAERAFRSALATAGSQTAAFVPGFSPDAVALLTDPINFFTIPISSSRILGQLFNAPQSFPLDSTFPFSARLPFVRSDFFFGGLRFFYVLAEGANYPRPVLAGEARVRVTAPPDAFPFLQTEDDRVTPGFVPGVTRDWAPLGDDLLSLLDACAAGLPLAVDVHTLRPTDLGSLGDGPSDWRFPFDALNVSEDNPRRCAMGAPRPPRAPDGSQPPQPVLFSVPLACPPLLLLLARARSASSYANATSPLRFTVADLLAAQGNASAVAALMARTIEGDSAQRVEVVAGNLFSTPLAFQHSVAGHYAACAPSTCSYTVISEPTPAALFVVGVSIFGGTSTTVIMFLSLFVYWLSVCGYHVDHLRDPQAHPLRWGAPPRADGEGKGEGEGEGEGGGAAGSGGPGAASEASSGGEGGRGGLLTSVNPIRAWPPGKGRAGLDF